MKQIILLIKNQLKDMNEWNVASISLNGKGSNNYTYSMPGWLLYVMEPDYNTVDRASAAINGMLSNKTLNELNVK